MAKEITYEEYKEEFFVPGDTVVKITEEELTKVKYKSLMIGSGLGILSCGLGLYLRLKSDVYSKKKCLHKSADKFVRDNLKK